MFFFKFMHSLGNMNSSVLPEVCKYGRRTRSSTSNVNKYIINKCKTGTYQNPFSLEVVEFGIFFLADELDLNPH